MQTIFYSTANIVSRPGKIVDLAEYRRSAARERTAVPDPSAGALGGV